jgi:pimeloyl-ACP methyl ester carboxylesterase
MEKELIYQHKKIFYRSIGEGKPVILIHGFGEDSSIWNGAVEYLRHQFHFFIPDLPGSGKSEAIDDMTMEGMAEVMYALIKEEDLDACPVIGHSMGGYIALALVDKYPKHVSALGLSHSSAYADSEEKKATRRKGIAFIQEHGGFEFLKTVIPNLFSPVSKEEMPEKIAEFTEQQRNFLPGPLVSYYEGMIQRPDRTHIFQQPGLPVLFIMGKYDKAVPMEDSLKQSHMPEKAYIHILQKSGHMGMIEEADLSNKALQEFLADI